MPPPTSKDVQDLVRAMSTLNVGVRRLADEIGKYNKAVGKKPYTVPLVNYLNGEREVIGEATVNPDGTVDGTIQSEHAGAIQSWADSRSFSIQEKED